MTTTYDLQNIQSETLSMILKQLSKRVLIIYTASVATVFRCTVRYIIFML